MIRNTFQSKTSQHRLKMLSTYMQNRFSYSVNNSGKDSDSKDPQERQNANNQENSQKKGFFSILKRTAFLAFTGIVGGLLGYAVFGQNNKKGTGTVNQVKDKKPKTFQLGGEWSLIDSQSKPFSSKDLAGSYYLIYFGYALCPDICPTTLRYVSNVLRHINETQEGKKINLKMVFVSLDPKRDSPQKIKEYVNLFDPSIIGLTGRDENDEQYKKTLASFKVYSNKIMTEEGNSYNIDHTSIVFLMDPVSQFIGSINPCKTQRETADELFFKIKTHQFANKQNQERL